MKYSAHWLISVEAAGCFCSGTLCASLAGYLRHNLFVSTAVRVRVIMFQLSILQVLLWIRSVVIK